MVNRVGGVNTDFTNIRDWQAAYNEGAYQYLANVLQNADDADTINIDKQKVTQAGLIYAYEQMKKDENDTVSISSKEEKEDKEAEAKSKTNEVDYELLQLASQYGVINTENEATKEKYFNIKNKIETVKEDSQNAMLTAYESLKNEIKGLEKDAENDKKAANEEEKEQQAIFSDERVHKNNFFNSLLTANELDEYAEAMAE